MLPPSRPSAQPWIFHPRVSLAAPEVTCDWAARTRALTTLLSDVVPVTLVERLEEQLGRAPIRHRGWLAVPERGDIFGFVSQEALEGPNAGPPPVEQIARVIARGAGWGAVVGLGGAG